MIIADLHIHGKYSQGTSNNLSFETLTKWARVKGVTLLGTGDFTHPLWWKDITEQLKENSNGILTTKDGFPFILQTEISLIYTHNEKGRRVHMVVLAPSLKAAERITTFLKTKGRVDYDGRPIFKITARDFVKELRSINSDIEIIPAHIWTPWFSLFGSKSGYDSIEEAFGDQLEHIHAFETGISSDPPMNWRVSQLDRLQIVSFSDLHSFWPWRIGREATVFDCPLEYKSILQGIRTGKGLIKTIEVNPNYGKYHFDGHRKCNVCLHPTKTKELHNLCPSCGKPLTIGVQYRVEELADRKEGYKPKNAKPFTSLIPLSEIISTIVGKALTTKTVWGIYNKLLEQEKDELTVLEQTPIEKIRKIVGSDLAHAIKMNREGKIKINPGYDGEYGTLNFKEKTGLNKFF